MAERGTPVGRLSGVVIGTVLCGAILLGGLLASLAYAQVMRGTITEAEPHGQIQRDTSPITSAGAAAPRPTARPAAPAVGDLRSLKGYQGGSVRLMVNEGAYLMQERALDENDSKTLSWVWSTYEKLDVADGTTIRLLQVNPSSVHVEILGGTYAGRRGWVSRIYLGA